MRARGVAALALLLGGCGPSVQGLLADGHLREATCAAYDGHDARRVGDALATLADVQVHVQVVDDDAVRAARSARPTQVPVTLLRVEAQTAMLPLDGASLEAAVGTVVGDAAALPPRWETFAWWTGERLPPPHTGQTYLTGGNVLRFGAAALSLGLSLLFTDFRPDVTRVEPTWAEYERAAPLAARLMTSTARRGCVAHAPGSAAGQRCVWYFLYAARDEVPVALSLSTRFEASRLGEGDRDEPPCSVVRAAYVTLGPPEGLRARLDAVFGGGARRLRDVADPYPLPRAAAWERLARVFDAR